MQDNEIRFSKEIGKIIKNLRQKSSKKYVLICDENGIADSTLDAVEKGIRSPKIYTVLRIIKALGLSYKEFGEILDNKLSSDLFTHK
ncbi:MAG: helix-turn-helix transcriptional regulator [bacterium]|nr:helix-turn-helix transcriptional regulator [bacterium]